MLTDPTWPLLHTSLFCCPSITAQALRAAMVAAELPLRGKLRAQATILSTDECILEVLCQSSLVYTPHKQRGITRIDFGSGLV